jgi:DNA-binding response OmpR family regulator
MDHPNRIMSRNFLMKRLHGCEAPPVDRVTDVRVGRLRRRIEAKKEGRLAPPFECLTLLDVYRCER